MRKYVRQSEAWRRGSHLGWRLFCVLSLVRWIAASLLVIMVALSAACSGHGPDAGAPGVFSVPVEVSPSVRVDTKWSACPELSSEDSTQAAAEGLIERYRTDSMGEWTMARAKDDFVQVTKETTLTVASLLPEVTLPAASDGLQAEKPVFTGVVNVLVGGPEGSIDTFAIRRADGGWLYGEGYSSAWLVHDLSLVTNLAGGAVGDLRFFPASSQLGWLIFTYEGADWAVPTVHMGPVSILRPGSSQWERVQHRLYPLDSIWSRMRWDGC